MSRPMVSHPSDGSRRPTGFANSISSSRFAPAQPLHGRRESASGCGRHRSFANTDQLKPGDEIILQTPIGTCTYKVDRAPFVVTPADTSVVGPTAAPSLTLTTCHPKGSAAKRLVVRATLQGPAVSA